MKTALTRSLFILMILFQISLSCFGQKYNYQYDLLDRFESIEYDYYVLIKGTPKDSIGKSLQIINRSQYIHWEVKHYNYKDWTVLKINILDPFTKTFVLNGLLTDFFSNYFKNVPRLNESHAGILIGIDSTNALSFINYIDKQSQKEMTSCEVNSVFQDNRKGIVSSCVAGIVMPVGSHRIMDYDETLKHFKIKLKRITKKPKNSKIYTLSSYLKYTQKDKDISPNKDSLQTKNSINKNQLLGSWQLTDIEGNTLNSSAVNSIVSNRITLNFNAKNIFVYSYNYRNERLADSCTYHLESTSSKIKVSCTNEEYDYEIISCSSDILKLNTDGVSGRIYVYKKEE